MSVLCERLQKVNEAGIYQLNCPLDELRSAIAQADFGVFDADLAGAEGKGEFLAVVALAISAADWFGHNFDALADALGDLAWQPASGYVLLLRNGDATLGLSTADHDVVTEILVNTVAFWKMQGKAFWVFCC